MYNQFCTVCCLDYMKSSVHAIILYYTIESGDHYQKRSQKQKIISLG